MTLILYTLFYRPQQLVWLWETKHKTLYDSVARYFRSDGGTPASGWAVWRSTKPNYDTLRLATSRFAVGLLFPTAATTQRINVDDASVSVLCRLARAI